MIRGGFFRLRSGRRWPLWLEMALRSIALLVAKPQPIPRKLEETRQRDFIASYEKLLNRLDADEVVVFVDAVHPEYQASGLLGSERPARCS